MMVKVHGGMLAIVFLGIFLLFPAPVFCASETVKACGMAEVVDGNLGRAKTQALQEAQRNAVEIGLGTLIDSSTIVENAVLIQDRIYSRASGYVTDYHVTSEGATPSGHAYETCIEASVATATIKDDLNAIGILKQRVGNPRFMSVYVPRTHASADARSLAVREAKSTIDNVFLGKGFLVIDQSIAAKFDRQVERQRPGSSDLTGLSKLASTYQAELLLIFDVHAAERTELSNSFFKEVMLTLDLRSIASGSAEMVSTNRGSKTVRMSKSTQPPYEDSSFVVQAMRPLAQTVADKSMQETLSYFERRTNEGTLYTCRFDGFGQDEMNAIVNVIENMAGTRDKNVRRQSDGRLQVDINYLGKPFDLQRALTSELKRDGLFVKTGLVEGTHLRFLKKK